ALALTVGALDGPGLVVPVRLRRDVTTDRRRWLWWRRAACCPGVLFMLWWATGLLGAHFATNARPSAIPECRELGGGPVADVATKPSDGIAVRSWLVRPSKRRRTLSCSQPLSTATGCRCWGAANGTSRRLVGAARRSAQHRRQRADAHRDGLAR